MNFYKSSFLIGLISILSSCGSYLSQPVDFEAPKSGEISETTKRLRKLPTPEEKVVVGVYNFRDLTGQYKPSDVGSTFSTAVTQGATSILIKALEDSGWFTAIERENIGNLLNERNIIRSTRQEYQGGNSNEPQLPPLLYAGILLEGGIVSYDTNIMTGGLGARYLGVGASTQYRQDRVTIYLRAISTSSGKILKNIYISKTILSQALDASLFKYVSFQRLLEAETGFTRNEPVQIAVKEAIEKAVEGLVIEGIEDKIWLPKEGEVLSDSLISDYREDKDEEELSGLYNRKYIERKYNSAIGVSLGGSLLSADYSNNNLAPQLTLDYKRDIYRSLALQLSGSIFELNSGVAFTETFAGLDAGLNYTLLPSDKLTPFAQAGAGFLTRLSESDIQESKNNFFKLHYGLGMEYLIKDNLGIKAFATHNITLSDELDYTINGTRDDHYFNFGIGVNFYLGNSNNNN
ncbi:CsgG/HfaB family protein [Salegentibacter sp. Hel_I_6]|uniref:CsgG/HfaB family protein n=1 Tax=Salegentibacter sp. Hel_I_6 TaxID=1250278 RepID=UPI000567A6A2|nr:CsgG/HfaB family protein [Salegentibacter sp. Hel_I_6]